jgi:hypothetical protein
MDSKERREKRFERRKAQRESKRQTLNSKFGDYDKIFTFDNLYDAYKQCCKGVGWKSSTQRYRVNALLNINKTLNELKECKFKSAGFYEFDIFERGKPRHIKSVHISERIVQRCLCDNSLVPMLGRSLIFDNGACMKGKGIDFSLDRLNRHLQRHWKKHGNEGYILLIDFSKFFDRIQHEPLIRELRRRFTDERLLTLVTNSIKDFGMEGLGLGSQISQICALTYPSRVDHFIKEVLGIEGYGRYMDDSYLIHHDKSYLQFCLTKIKELCDQYGIVLNPKKTQIIKLSRGMTFLKTGFILTKTGGIIRKANKKSINRMRRKLRKFSRWVESGRMTEADMHTSYMSWKGYIGRCNANNTVHKMDRFYAELIRDIHKNATPS